MTENILFTKEILFHIKSEDELISKQMKVLQGLEVLGLRYEIKRTNKDITDTPTWKVTVYKD